MENETKVITTVEPSLRENFFQGGATNSTKGRANQDSLASQTVADTTILSSDTIDNLLASNELSRIVLEAPVQDALKKGLIINILKADGSIDRKKTNLVNQRLSKLNYLKKVQDLLISSRRYGYSLAYISARESVSSSTSNPLSNKFEVEGFNVIEKDYIRSLKKESNILDSSYGLINEVKISQYRPNALNLNIDLNPSPTDRNTSIVQDKTVLIHPSRVIFTEEFAKPDSFGLSIFQQLMDRFIIFDAVEWSIGQLIYRLNFLVYATSKQNAEAITLSGGVNKMEQEINSSTLALIGKDDELRSVDTSRGIDPEQYINAAGTILSIHTNIPKQRLIGNSAGAIAGAKEDAKRYAEYLTRLFRSRIEPIVRQMVEIICRELNIKNSFSIALPELVELDAKEKSEIALLEGSIVEQNLKILRDTVTFLKTNWYAPSKAQIASALEAATAHTLLDSEKLVPLLTQDVEELQDVDYILKQINILQNIRNLGFGNKVDVRKMIKSLEDGSVPFEFEDLLEILGESEGVMPGSIDTAGTQDKGDTNNNDNAQNRNTSLATAINGTKSNNSTQVNKKLPPSGGTSEGVDYDPSNLGSAR